MGRGCWGTEMTLNREFLGRGAQIFDKTKFIFFSRYYLTSKKKLGSSSIWYARNKRVNCEGGEGVRGEGGGGRGVQNPLSLIEG